MKTVSLELSKQLKEAGYPQEGQFYWFNKGGEFVFLTHDKVSKIGGLLSNYNASPTADEILECLPKVLPDKLNLTICCLKNGWFVDYEDLDKKKIPYLEKDFTLADAAARMYLYLKKEGLL